MLVLKREYVDTWPIVLVLKREYVDTWPCVGIKERVYRYMALCWY